MKLQYGGSCGVIFQRLARVPRTAFPDRKGSPGPSRCRGSRRWPGSAARTGGPRRKTEQQIEHCTPFTLHTGHSSQCPNGAWMLWAVTPESQVWLLPLPCRRDCEWKFALRACRFFLSLGTHKSAAPNFQSLWSSHISFHFMDSLQVFPVSELGLTPQRCIFDFFFKALESHIYESKPPEHTPVQSCSDQV